MIGKKILTACEGDLDTVSYHDPCHLKKSQGISEQPRKLIIEIYADSLR